MRYSRLTIVTEVEHAGGDAVAEELLAIATARAERALREEGAKPCGGDGWVAAIAAPMPLATDPRGRTVSQGLNDIADALLAIKTECGDIVADPDRAQAVHALAIDAENKVREVRRAMRKPRQEPPTKGSASLS